MSILVEVAEKAEVSVEGVVRVLTREPVSEAIKERVLAVLDDLSPEKTRVLQRFALAALHDQLPRPLTEPDGEEDALAAETPRVALGSGEDVGERMPVPRQDQAHLVQLSSVLEELAEAVRDLRREKDAERRERVDDLGILIDLTSTAWQGVERRLGRLERQLGQLEQRPEARPTPRIVAPPPAPPQAGDRAGPAPPEPDAAPSWRGLRPLAAAALALVGVIGAALALYQVYWRGAEVGSVVSARTSPVGATSATEEARTTAAPSTSARTTSSPTRPAPSTAETPSAVLGTSATSTTQPKTTTAPSQQPKTTTAPTQKPKTTTAPAQKTEPRRTPAPAGPSTTVQGVTTVAPPEASGFRPARNWAWAPVVGADYYAVEFQRNGERFYRELTEKPRLRLPDSVVFRPGAYRWTVRPGFGEQAANQLGPPLVDSSFTVA